MIPGRILLRAATVLALTRGGVAPYPTMAGEGIFDSKMQPVTELMQEGMTPLAMVYTDTESRTNLNTSGGRPNWKRTIDLMIEIGIGSAAKKNASTGEQVQWQWIETDPELEGMLDLFEAEIDLALNAIDNPYATYWRKLIKTVIGWESVPHRSAEQSARYAVRSIVIECELAADCPPMPVVDVDTAAINGGSLFAGVPHLASLEAIIRGNPEVFAPTLAMLTGRAQQVPLPKLKTIHIEQEHAAGAVVVQDVQTGQ